MQRVKVRRLGDILPGQTHRGRLCDFIPCIACKEEHVRTQQSGVATRGIGFELERHRKAAGMNLQEVGEALGVSASTISRLENGKREPTSEEVASILTAIGVTGDERGQLLEQSRGQNNVGLHTATLSVQSRIYQEFERRATSIINFELMLIPGLLQTADYARAAIATFQFHESEGEIESRVARRLARQAILTRRTPPDLNFILTEAALRLPMGGHKVMAAQVRHLTEVAQRPGVTIRVVPAKVVAHPGLTGSLVLLGFSDAPTVAYIESRVSGVFFDDSAVVHQHKMVANKLQELALNNEESVELMTGIEQDLRRG
jgi:transcriptional regulator with XRE-family HTH domain